MLTHYPLYLGGVALKHSETIQVFDKYHHTAIAEVSIADPMMMAQAIALAVESWPFCSALSAFDRQQILFRCVTGIEQCAALLAQTLCQEVGKPIKDARLEVQRLIETFRFAAEEATRIHAEVLHLDVTARALAYSGFYRRFPMGVCGFITPFNFPLNLAAHKIAPAIAVGNPFILKPASATPIATLLLAEILSQSGLPKGSFSVLPATREAAGVMIGHKDIQFVSFTGSAAVGFDLLKRANKQKVALELGGNAACIVDKDADLACVMPRILMGAYAQSGQSCISVQRVMVHRAIYEPFKTALLQAVKTLIVGDPHIEDTFVGPLISEQEAIRLEQSINQAKQAGGVVLIGGQRQGSLIMPCVLESVPEDCRIVSEEAFGPVLVLSVFDDFKHALSMVNNSRFGLQAGVFTRDIERAYQAYHAINAGAVVINDVPTFRVDNMPYGGNKDSGNTREGVRFAIEEMSFIKSMIIRHQESLL